MSVSESLFSTLNLTPFDSHFFYIKRAISLRIDLTGTWTISS